MSTNFDKLDKYFLGCNLYHAFAIVVATLNHELRRVGLDLTYPQFLILETVFRRPGLSQSELARENAKDSGAVTRSVAYLEKQDFLETKWINGCTKGVFPTKKAEAIRPLLEKAIQETLDRACVDIVRPVHPTIKPSRRSTACAINLIP